MYVLVSLWFSTLMREFFFNVDKVIFGLISKLYDLLILIARTSPLSQGDIASMANRIYALLAVFMIFKVTFSLIMYVVNPDDFTEKGKGVGKLLANIVISLALLILTPFAFRYAFQFQEIMLEDNSMAALVFGNDYGENSFFTSAGEKMAFIAFSPFFVPNKSFIELGECTTLYEEQYDADGETKSIVFRPECSGLDPETYDPLDGTPTGMYALTRKNGDATKEQDNFRLVDLQNYVAGIENSSFGLAYRIDLATATDSGKTRFVIDYSFLISTLVGIVIVLLLINYCMDIAVRSIKLAFLQLIAPIPIISYVDPKSGKDGMFKKWYKMCFSTFISLFVRLVVIYLAIYVISRIEDGKMVDVITGSYVTSTLVKVFILIGALMFAKQFPKILEGLGIKLDGAGKFTLNPLKKVSEEALGGKAIQKAGKVGLGLAGAGVAGAAAFGTNLLANRGNLLSAAAGAIGATRRGIGSAFKGKKFGEVFSNSYSGSMKARENRAERKELDISAFDVAGENIKRAMHIPNQSSKFESDLKYLSEYEKAGNSAKTRAEGEIDKKLSSITVAGNNLGALKQKVEILKNTDTTGFSDADKNKLAQDIANAEADFFKNRKAAVNAYINNSQNLGVYDATTRVDLTSAFAGVSDNIVSGNVSIMEQLNDDHKLGISVNTSDIGKSIQSAADAQMKIHQNPEYKKASLIQQQASKEKNR